MRNFSENIPPRGISYIIMQVILVLLVIIIAGMLINTNAQTISSKRGMAGDLKTNADCAVVDSLTWYYNWSDRPTAGVISSYQNYIEYCPMLWNGSWNVTALTDYLDTHPEVQYLLTFNEPNFSLQANMTPAAAASIWPQIETIADKYKLKIVSPAMSYCSERCLSGYDKAHGTKWLDDFFSICPECRVDHIAVHVYDTWLYGFKGVVDLYKKYGKPLWITEFDYSNSNASSQHAALMTDVLDYMEKDPDIFRYAWFLSRSDNVTASTDLFEQASGTLTDLGKIYMNMSSYDKDYYHGVNKVIEAEHYISKSVTYCNWNGTVCTWPYSIQLEPTSDVSGKLDAFHFASPTANTNDTLFYNVDIPASQSYNIDFRVNATAASTISVRTTTGNILSGTTASLNTSGTWETKTLANVNLTAGKQKIYLTAANGTSLKLNWFRINCTGNCSLVTGVDDLLTTELIIPDGFDYVVFNVAGNVVKEGNVPPDMSISQATFKPEGLTAGIYIIKFISDKNTSTRKLIIQD